MEEVLEVYSRQQDPQRPVVGLDEPERSGDSRRQIEIGVTQRQCRSRRMTEKDIVEKELR